LGVGVRQGALILNVMGATVLVAGSYALFERKRLFAIAVVLSVISITATRILLVSQQHWAALLSRGCTILLIAFFSVPILGYVLRSGRVTADKIFAAVCVYMLIGFAWTVAYARIDECQPDSFVAVAANAHNDYVARAMQWLYFSFMTLTAVGYGDIVPHSPAARTLATLEASTGSNLSHRCWWRVWSACTSSMRAVQPRAKINLAAPKERSARTEPRIPDDF
jgi:voltage-gated potassium channel